MYSAIYSFTNDMAMELFKSYGLKLKVERGHRVFPRSDKAIDVVKTFEKMLKDAGVQVELSSPVKCIKVDSNNKVSGIQLTSGKTILADRVILATGGMSYPLTGSTGDGYRMATDLGHMCTDLSPSLVGLETLVDIPKELVGLSLRNIGICLYRNGKKIYEDFGELEFRNYGIDGPLVKSASCYIAREGKYRIDIDLKPALSHEKLDKRIQRDFEEIGRAHV